MELLKRRSLGFAVLLLLFAGGLRAASAPPVSPYAVYAAFTVNLTRFITWPESVLPAPDSPIVIGTFARDPLNAELDAAVRDEVVNGHPLRVIRLQRPEDVAKCHVVFFAKDTPRLAQVLAASVGKPILTISDAEGFGSLGGHVRFVPQPPNIKLSISVVNLKASGLEARSQLLRIAAVEP